MNNYRMGVRPSDIGKSGKCGNQKVHILEILDHERVLVRNKNGAKLARIVSRSNTLVLEQ